MCAWASRFYWRKHISHELVPRSWCCSRLEISKDNWVSGQRERVLHLHFALSGAWGQIWYAIYDVRDGTDCTCAYVPHMSSFIFSPSSASRSSSARLNWRETRPRYRSVISSTLRLTRTYWWVSRGGPLLPRKQRLGTAKEMQEQSTHRYSSLNDWNELSWLVLFSNRFLGVSNCWKLIGVVFSYHRVMEPQASNSMQ